MTSNLITELRDLVPLRPHRPVEAYRLAERQAAQYVQSLGLAHAPVPIEPIKAVPKVRVRYVANWPASGTTKWTHSTWTVVIHATEPPGRQRFSLAHEFKHILDDRFLPTIYPSEGYTGTERFRESVCDYFAGCLLVPPDWLRQAWKDGIHDSFVLAQEFEVSVPAIEVRLSQLGLADRRNRHEPRTYFRFLSALDGMEAA